MKHFFHNATYTLCAILIACAFVAPGRAHAQLGGILGSLLGGSGDPVVVVGDVSPTNTLNLIKTTLTEVSTALSTVAQQSLVFKEFTLDSIARNLAQNAMNQLTADMVKWINGGMNGNPAFVTNLEDFLLDVTDRTVGEFIYGSELDRLCEPIRFQVKAALLNQYIEEGRDKYTPQCTMGNVANVDVEAFLDGDFSKGGWGAYFELMIGGNNDLVKAYLDGSVEMYTRSLDAQNVEQEKLGWGDGFLSREGCQLIENTTGFAQQRCEILTPGALVRDSLAYMVGELPAQRLLQVDEFNEIFTALSSSLTNQAIGGLNGLLGLGGNSKYSDNRFGSGSQSYLDALSSEQFLSGESVSTNVLAQAIAAETEYGKIQRTIITAVNDLKDEVAQAKKTYPSCFKLNLPSKLESDLKTATTNASTSAQVLTVLTSLQTSLRTATSTAAQSRVYAQYNELKQNDLIRTDYDNEKLRVEFLELDFAIRVDEFEGDIEDRIRQCRNSNND